MGAEEGGEFVPGEYRVSGKIKAFLVEDKGVLQLGLN
jgi:hypothetical protein